MLMQSLRMTWRDWRAGELRFLLLALVVAVAALASVGFFVDRMQAGLQQDAHQLLGGDMVIASDKKLADDWFDEAKRLDLTWGETRIFPSMASIVSDNGEPLTRLVSIKAVSKEYPLRGTLKTAVQLEGEGEATRDTPVNGTVWADKALLLALDLSAGDKITLGNTVFTISRILVSEPDKSLSFVNFAPRIMMSLPDLEATGLVQPASRVSYRLILSGEAHAIETYRKWAKSRLDNEANKGIRLETLESSRPEMNTTLNRGEQFLSLVALLSAMLAAVAIAMAARRFVVRHLDACAMLRCLGMTQNEVTALYLTEFLLVGLVGTVIGAMLGFAGHFVLLEILGSFVLRDVPLPGWLPAVKSIATGLILLVGFALPPVLQLRNVPHNRVIRREREAPKPLTLLTYCCGLAVFVLLLLWQAGDLKLGLYTAGGFMGGLAVFALVGWLSLKGLHVLRRNLNNPDWRFALTSLERRPGTTLVQIVALSCGLMALLLLTVVRADLVSEWKKATPPDTPNHFVINILPEQKADMAALMETAGIENPGLYPMVRGRLLAINDRPVRDIAFSDMRSQRMVLREFNLSYLDVLPDRNQIVKGRWFDHAHNEISIEEGMAKRLDLSIGDTMTFDITGTEVDAVVTSFRKVDWGSIRVNFFAVMNPESLKDMPQTWITAFYLPPEKIRFAGELTRAFPNLTVIDVGSIILRIQTMLDQVIIAVEFLFLFTLLSGMLVLYAALVGSQDERMREAGLLRALGATRSQLKQAQRVEFLLIGSLGGLMAATGADVIGWVLASQVFDFAWTFNPLVWLTGLVAGSLCAMAGGWLGLRQILNHPPLQTLREE
ncbi:FtsX-like permease family protein [Oxalobacter vibrioformis]|uniref:FtsX-like permease family protein n=2 Tax=Oxalobacter vibrioformis TaxID=933080 RepID=A0A9E9LVN0_9BURK|nr:FtsX-like permease family protein [Oxalobacter vibrioformis]WAW10565.1 FtsX-like permease family protein [Oxalobacter vibrioformis]